MSLLSVSLRHHRRHGAPPPPPGTGLLMPRGPTGSRWGPDATGPDGGFPTMRTPTYGSTPAASFTPFAQAGDFYDSIGINVHPVYAGYTTAGERATAIDRIQELGIRHLRGLGLYSPANKLDGTFGQKSQFWLIECIAANAARNVSSGGPDGTGEQPTFNKVGTNEEREYLTTVWESQNAYKVDPASADGGESYLRPCFGPPGVVTRTSDHWEGNFYGSNKSTSPTTAGAEIGWSGVDLLAGPNEPNNGRSPTFYGDLPGEHGIRWLGHQLTDVRNDPAYRDIELLGGESYVDFDTGRITAGPATMKQMPVVPFCHFTASQPWVDAGDYTGTRGQHGDFVAFHQYWSGHTPVWDETYGPWAGQTYGFFHNTSSVNGMLNPAASGVRFNRSIPIIQTEQGWYQHTGAGSGTWGQYAPPDVSGEYLIQSVLMNYLLGIKRTYIYKLSHEGGESAGNPPAMGLCLTNMTRTESYYAIKNLMGIVRFTQGSTSTPIQVPHTFTPGSTQFKQTATSGDPIRDMCPLLVLQQDDGYLVFVWRPRQLWHRGTYQSQRQGGATDAVAAAAARDVTDVRPTVLTIPAGLTVVGIAEPAKNPIRDPVDGHTYANPNDGQAFAAPGVGGAMALQVSGNQATVPVAGLTRVVKLA